mmetsp:Transcript_91204/g.197265  ORF Transcript_91204/g.197265 Transcript_91204/m.197265 type:complete len:214 (-) Transcript_91204:96-737(-)
MEKLKESQLSKGKGFINNEYERILNNLKSNSSLKSLKSSSDNNSNKVESYNKPYQRIDIRFDDQDGVKFTGVINYKNKVTEEITDVLDQFKKYDIKKDSPESKTKKNFKLSSSNYKNKWDKVIDVFTKKQKEHDERERSKSNPKTHQGLNMLRDINQQSKRECKSKKTSNDKNTSRKKDVHSIISEGVKQKKEKEKSTQMQRIDNGKDKEKNV